MIQLSLEEFKERVPTVAVSEDSNGTDPMKKYLPHVKTANLWLKKTLLGEILYLFLNNPERDNSLLGITPSPTDQEPTEGETEEVEPLDETENLEPEGDPEVSELQKKIDYVIEKCKDIIAYRTYLKSIPFIDLVDTGSGLAVVKNENLTPASRERVQSLIGGVLDTLTEYYDELLEYLEKNTEFHVMWKSAQTYTILTETFIHRIDDFKRYCKFDGDRIAFISLKPSMNNAINLKIKNFISLEYAQDLIAKIRTNGLTESDKVIIEDVKKAYAHFVIDSEKEAVSYIARVRTTMIENISNYPIYKASKEYTTYLARLAQTNDGSTFLSQM